MHPRIGWLGFGAALALALALGACDASRPTGDGAPLDTAVADAGGEGAVDDMTVALDSTVDAPVGSTTCDPARATCRALPTPCGRGEVRSVVNGCWGACVPITDCADVPERPDCDLTQVSCERVAPVCPDHYAPTRVGLCYGPCVPVVTCACTQGGPPSQCPSETPICYNFDKRCGPLGP